MLWALLSFLASFGRAGNRLTNEYFKISGISLILWGKLFIALYMLPFVLFVEWPTHPLFYILLVCQAPLAIFVDQKIFTLTAQHGGGIVSRIEPLSVIVLFFAWFLVTPSLFHSYMDTPLRFSLIIGVILLASFFTLRMKKCALSFSVLMQMTPLIVLSALISLIAAFTIRAAQYDSAVFVYIFVQSVLMSAMTFFVSIKKTEKLSDLLLSGHMMRAPLIISLVTSAAVFCKTYAYRYADNPAYITAIMMLSPFWILLFYKLKGQKEKGDIYSGIGVVCCGLALALLTL